MRTCHSGAMSKAVEKMRRISSGTSDICLTLPARAMSVIRSVRVRSRSAVRRALERAGWTSVSCVPSMTLRTKVTAKKRLDAARSSRR